MKENKSRTRNEYEIKIIENYNVIDRVRGDSISGVLEKVRFKHIGDKKRRE